MNPSLVFSLRLNAPEAMGVVDILNVLGIPSDNLSFSQATKIVVAAVIENYRQAGTIPRRTGFEYIEMLAPFTKPNISQRSARLKSAAELNKERTLPNLLAAHETPEHRSRRVRYEELMFRRNEDPINFTDQDLTELAGLIGEFQE